MPDIEYGDWAEYGPLLQDFDFTGPESSAVASRGYNNNATIGALGGARETIYRLTQSFEARGAGNEPWLDAGARLCALHHAASGPGGFDAFWNAGHCNTVTPAAVQPGSAHGGDLDLWAAGTVTSWAYSGSPLIGDTYTCSCFTGITGWTYIAYDSTYAAPGWEYLHTVPAAVLMQIPGWFEYISAHPRSDPQPQVYPVNVDVKDFQLTVPYAQGTDAAVSATGYRVPSPPYVLTSGPYAGYGACPPTSEATGWAADLNVSGSAGASSGSLDFLGVSPGAIQQWAVVSDLVAADADPGAAANNRITGGVDYNAWWTVMARFPLDVPEVLDVLRWRQRDDGLGMTGAARHRAGTSLQRGLRHRGYR